MSLRALLGASLVALLAFCALTVLVAAGTTNRLDLFGVQHLVPFYSPGVGSSKSLPALIGYHELHHPNAGAILRAGAGAGGSSLLLLLVAAGLCRRGRSLLAVVWLVAFAAVAFVEVAVRLTVSRPPILSGGGDVAAGFHHSFPSGHAARSAVVAAAAVCLWRRAWPAFAGWFVFVVVSFELEGQHAVSDLAGGTLLALAAIGVVLAVRERERSSGRSSVSFGPAGKIRRSSRLRLTQR